MRILVVYGSKRGSTAEIAQMLGQDLRAEGLHVEVTAADAVRDVVAYDAVIVGGALYADRWHRAARRFVRAQRKALRGMPVWFFSSGPLDYSATHSVIPPTTQVARLMETVGARGHVTFGGRLAEDVKGPVARALVRNGRGGDYRDRGAIAAWARQVSGSLNLLTW